MLERDVDCAHIAAAARLNPATNLTHTKTKRKVIVRHRTGREPLVVTMGQGKSSLRVFGIMVSRTFQSLKFVDFQKCRDM